MNEKIENCGGDFFPNRCLTGNRFEPGSVFNYSVYITVGAPKTDAALYVLLEYDPKTLTPVLEHFVKEGLMPPGMFLYLNAGTLPATLPGGCGRGMRAEEFDQIGPEFPNLLVEELIPAAEKVAGVRLSENPDMHMITGGSSGGICAWNAAWFRNDFFRRVFLSSPTFSAMRGGEEPMVLVRKTESRPIRIYMTVGTNEPDYFFGSSFYAACNARRAFEFAQYDFRFELFPGEGHCSHRDEPALLRRVMTYLWRNWRTEPVVTQGNQIRIANLLEPGSEWTEVDEPMPQVGKNVRTALGEYSFSGDSIYFTSNGIRRKVADGFGEITGLALSSDNWRLYIADARRRFIYAMSVREDGTLENLYRHAPLHIAYDCRTVGASGICIASCDRLFAATELGIQSVVSFGLMDLILPLPGDVPADAVALCGNLLYASSGGRVFRRPLQVSERQGLDPAAPNCPGYSDGFNYSLPHLPQ